MGERKIAVGLNASSEPTDGFGIRAEWFLGPAHTTTHPPVGTDIARGETESLEYMAFGPDKVQYFSPNPGAGD